MNGSYVKPLYVNLQPSPLLNEDVSTFASMIGGSEPTVYVRRPDLLTYLNEYVLKYLLRTYIVPCIIGNTTLRVMRECAFDSRVHPRPAVLLPVLVAASKECLPCLHNLHSLLSLP
jgi:hypothetical protein